MTKGTIQNRDAFLKKIANKLERSQKTMVDKPMWQHQPQWEVHKEANTEELFNIFTKSCDAVHIRVFETLEVELPDTLEQVISKYGGGPVVVGDDPRFQEYNLEDVLNSFNALKWNPSLGRENIDQAAVANIGISFSDITLAESGTALFFHDKNKARSVSLLPKTSIVIISKKTLVPRITQAMQVIEKRVQAGEKIASYINLVSGPSNSADIEMNLVIGVHGPVNVAYLVVE